MYISHTHKTTDLEHHQGEEKRMAGSILWVLFKEIGVWASVHLCLYFHKSPQTTWNMTCSQRYTQRVVVDIPISSWPTQPLSYLHEAYKK